MARQNLHSSRDTAWPHPRILDSLLLGSTLDGALSLSGSVASLLGEVVCRLGCLLRSVGGSLAGLLLGAASNLRGLVDDVGCEVARLVDDALTASATLGAGLDVRVGRVEDVCDEVAALVDEVAERLLSGLGVGLALLGGRVGGALSLGRGVGCCLGGLVGGLVALLLGYTGLLGGIVVGVRGEVGGLLNERVTLLLSRRGEVRSLRDSGRGE